MVNTPRYSDVAFGGIASGYAQQQAADAAFKQSMAQQAGQFESERPPLSATLDEVAHRLNGVLNLLSAMQDRMHGANPSAGNKSSDAPDRPGGVFGSIDRIFNTINAMEALAERQLRTI